MDRAETLTLATKVALKVALYPPASSQYSKYVLFDRWVVNMLREAVLGDPEKAEAILTQEGFKGGYIA